jgi:transketolase
MRRAFVDTLTQMAQQDSRVVLLTGDLGYQVFDQFVARVGPRYVNVGIAEGLLVAAAAGMALEGCRPFAYSIASFMTGRPFEQIRFCVAYPRLPVVIVGAGGGYCYAKSGVSHHAPDDFALMCLLPGMTVVAPGDPNEVRSLLPQLLTIPGPAYIRIGKFGEPTYEGLDPIVLGRARLLRAGHGVAILTTGETAHLALQAAGRLAVERITPLVRQFHTIKPLDTAALEEMAGQADTFVVVEEACPQAGLYASVLAWANDHHKVRLVRLGPPDEFALGNLAIDTLRAKYRFDVEAIVQTCRNLWRKT